MGRPHHHAAHGPPPPQAGEDGGVVFIRNGVCRVGVTLIPGPSPLEGEGRFCGGGWALTLSREDDADASCAQALSHWERAFCWGDG